MATVLLVSFTHLARDPRVMRHVDALRGHYEVVTCGKGPRPAGVTEHVQIPDAAEHLPLTPLGLLGLGARSAGLAYRHLPAANEARERAVGLQFDVAISNDITALPVTISIAGSRPVIADLHEYAPKEMEEDWRWRLMVQPFVTELCRTYLTKAAAVTTVADSIAEEYRREYGVDPVTITNAARNRSPLVRPVGLPIRLVHSGMAIPNRRLEVMIDAAAGLPNVALDLYLIPSIRAQSYLGRIRLRAARTPNVRVVDPVPMAQLPDALDGYDVGVHLLAPTSFNNAYALPNKFYDFVQSGLGVVIGPSPEMAALTHEFGLGHVLVDFELGTLRTALAALDPDRVRTWKKAACRAAPALSAQEQAERLVEVVRSVLSA